MNNPNPMNTAHKLSRLANRYRRIRRRLFDLQADKVSEIITAERNKREPNLGNILASITRLERRAAELEAA